MTQAWPRSGRLDLECPLKMMTSRTLPWRVKRQNRARFKSGFLIDQSMLERYRVGFAAYAGWGLICDRSPGAGADGWGATAAMVAVCCCLNGERRRTFN